MAKTSTYADVLTMTFSIQSTPDRPLADLWGALDSARGQFVGDWLKSRITAWRWSTEITLGKAGWHPHAPFLIFGNDLDAARLRTECIDRWARIVHELGYHADPDAQHIERITRTRTRALRYASKGLSASPAGSITPATLLDRAAAGDATAAAYWIELDAAAHGRRFQGTGGQLRQRSIPPMDLDQLIAAGAI